MANVKISELTAATTVAATDELEINASGTSKKATAQKLADFAASSTNTLTNKTFDSGGTGNVLKINGATASYLGGWIFGDGADGNVTVSGAVTLARDMFYNNLTISAGAAISTAGYRIFVAGTLDISAAPAGAIIRNGTSASLATGGTALANATLGGSNLGRNGTSGGTGVGGAGSLGTGGSVSASAAAGSGGTSGFGSNAGGTGGAATSVGTFYPVAFDGQIGAYTSGTTLTLQAAGGGGSSGGAGGGDGTYNGKNGGGGGSGGGTIVVVAKTIARGSNTTAGIIQAIGGNGGNGGTAVGQGGGGGGGAGGGGGFVIIGYGNLTGSEITNAIDVSGGAGGTGSTVGTGTGGNGGGSGGSGVVYLWQVGSAPVVTATVSGSAGGTRSGVTGGSGASANTKQVNL